MQPIELCAFCACKQRPWPNNRTSTSFSACKQRQQLNMAFDNVIHTKSIAPTTPLHFPFPNNGDNLQMELDMAPVTNPMTQPLFLLFPSTINTNGKKMIPMMASITTITMHVLTPVILMMKRMTLAMATQLMHTPTAKSNQAATPTIARAPTLPLNCQVYMLLAP
jgi:hypothetical protein